MKGKLQHGFGENDGRASLLVCGDDEEEREARVGCLLYHLHTLRQHQLRNRQLLAPVAHKTAHMERAEVAPEPREVESDWFVEGGEPSPLKGAVLQ